MRSMLWGVVLALALAGCGSGGAVRPVCVNGMCYLPKSRLERVDVDRFHVDEETGAWVVVVVNRGAMPWGVSVVATDPAGRAVETPAALVAPGARREFSGRFTLPDDGLWRVTVATRIHYPSELRDI